jgi:hypothetical protein
MGSKKMLATMARTGCIRPKAFKDNAIKPVAAKG